MPSTKSLILLAFSALSRVSAQCLPTKDIGWRHKPDVKDSRVSATVIYNGLSDPRGIRFMQDTLLVVDSGVGLLTLVENKDGCAGWTKSVIVDNRDLNHGLAVNGTTIYASSVDNVFRYTWDPNSQKVTSTETLVAGMNLAQNHKTRTLELSGPWLLVSGGASSNIETESVDAAHGTAQIRRFALNGTIPSGGYDWLSGEVVAWGMRNAVGIRLSQDHTKLWTVENSADDLTYTSQDNHTTDVHFDNPAEEVNVVDLSDIGHYYGYPECFTAWNMTEAVSGTSLHTGDQFSIVSNVTDAQCQNATFNVPPRLSMQAHSAPLDLVFFNAANSNETTGIPKDYNSHAFVSFHGSWDRDPPTGYGVIRIPWNGDGPEASSDSGDGYSFVLQASDLSACPDNCIRPVGMAFDSQGRLFGSSDATGEIFIITNFTAGALGLKVTVTTLLHMAIVGLATTFLLS